MRKLKSVFYFGEAEERRTCLENDPKLRFRTKKGICAMVKVVAFFFGDKLIPPLKMTESLFHGARKKTRFGLGLMRSFPMEIMGVDRPDRTFLCKGPGNSTDPSHDILESRFFLVF